VNKESLQQQRLSPVPKDDNISFTVVFNADHLGRWDESLSLWRFNFFVHEATHIVDDIFRFKEIGNACFSEPITGEENINYLSYLIWTEYNAVRTSAEALASIGSINASDVEKYTIQVGYVDSFVALIKMLPDFLTKNITDFRERKIDIDTLTTIVFPILRQAMILATYVDAQLDGLKNGNRAEQFVEGKYSFFVERWSVIHDKIKILYESQKTFDKEAKGVIANEIRKLYYNCGFTLTDTEKGLYVGVCLHK
jgi:hypothetical protein